MKSDDALEEHFQKEAICNIRPEPIGDGRISQKMLKRLDFKKAPYAHARSPTEKWEMLYKALFPNDKNVPSACK